MSVRVRPEIKALVQQIAEKERRTVSQWFELAVERTLKQRGALPPDKDVA